MVLSYFLSFIEYITLPMHLPLYQPLVYEDNVNILKNIFVIEESLLITKCLHPVATGLTSGAFHICLSFPDSRHFTGLKCSSWGKLHGEHQDLSVSFVCRRVPHQCSIPSRCSNVVAFQRVPSLFERAQVSVGEGHRLVRVWHRVFSSIQFCLLVPRRLGFTVLLHPTLGG